MQNTPHMIAAVDEKTFVVFDGRTGDIAHIHTVVTHEGAEIQPTEAQEAEAMDLARAFDRTGEKDLQIIRADNFRTHIPQRVDLKTRTLVDEKLPGKGG